MKDVYVTNGSIVDKSMSMKLIQATSNVFPGQGKNGLDQRPSAWEEI